MRNFKNVLAVVLFMMGATLFAQTKLTGKVVDEYNQALPGADVIIKGTTQGTSSDFDGNFTLETSDTAGTLNVSFMGYNAKSLTFSGSQDFGNVQLMPSAESLSEVVIVGVADIAKDRETPVAVSTIKATEIVERLGSQEFPEILKATPSVYATKQGGGYGDARINIRGFDQKNTAVMINGMPVNDMENGWVYWSNWAGLSDVTTAMQVQRGLGSSKLAISSVGGTINIITSSSSSKEGGVVSASYGNDNYIKTVASYNTGKMENGFSTSLLLGRTSGDGYVDGTPFEGYNYYLAFGYDKGDHNIQLTVTGAPQEHFQRGYANPISQYIKYGENGEPDIKYNSDWGWRDGEIETFSGNFYHKPIASLNWDWKFNSTSKLSSVVYVSLGRGGSIGSIGRINGGKSYYGQFKDENGQVRIDDIIAWNQGGFDEFGGGRETYSGGGDLAYQGMYINGNNDSYGFESDGAHVYGDENGISQRSSMNSHNWFGLISNFNTELNENLKFDVGFDLRSYTGIHYRRLVDLLGADAYVDNDNINNTYNFTTETYEPSFSNILNVFKNVEEEEKIDYYNEGKVHWEGLFGQLEYKKENVSAFLQAAGSNQSFQRIDYFNYLDSDDEQTSDWVNILGGNIKGGVNLNLSERHNVFVNGGYYSKQPSFDAIFLNYVNDINENYKNEEILGFELGYGFRAERATFNLNLYRTSWAERFDRVSTDDVDISANATGIKEIHSGIEGDIKYRALDNLRFSAMISLGNWEYSGNATASFYENQNLVATETLYLDGVKVGDAAQFTSRLGLQWDVFKNFTFDVSQFFADKLYANLSDDFKYDNTTSSGYKGALRLPAYSLTDLGMSYKFNISDDMGLKLRVNVNNVADQVYISESRTNIHPGSYGSTGENWNGIDTGNGVFFGYGRTWNVSARFNF